jgi:hypothetical protein
MLYAYLTAIATNMARVAQFRKGKKHGKFAEKNGFTTQTDATNLSKKLVCYMILHPRITQPKADTPAIEWKPRSQNLRFFMTLLQGNSYIKKCKTGQNVKKTATSRANPCPLPAFQQRTLFMIACENYLFKYLQHSPHLKESIQRHGRTGQHLVSGRGQPF